MIEKLRESDGPTLGFALSGEVDAQSGERWTTLLAASIELHESVCVLLDVTEYKGGGPRMMSDLNWVAYHSAAIRKLAFVSGEGWWSWYQSYDRPLVGRGKEAWFESANRNDAWLWLRTG